MTDTKQQLLAVQDQLAAVRYKLQSVITDLDAPIDARAKRGFILHDAREALAILDTIIAQQPDVEGLVGKLRELAFEVDEEGSGYVVCLVDLIPAIKEHFRERG